MPPFGSTEHRQLEKLSINLIHALLPTFFQCFEFIIEQENTLKKTFRQIRVRLCFD